MSTFRAVSCGFRSQIGSHGRRAFWHWIVIFLGSNLRVQLDVNGSQPTYACEIGKCFRSSATR